MYFAESRISFPHAVYRNHHHHHHHHHVCIIIVLVFPASVYLFLSLLELTGPTRMAEPLLLSSLERVFETEPAV